MKSVQSLSSERVNNIIQEVLRKNEADLLAEWTREQKAAGTRDDLISENELRQQSAEFLRLFRAAVQTGNFSRIQDVEWRPVRDMLEALSRDRGLKGFSPSETATFVFSFKKPLFSRIRAELGSNSDLLADELWAATEVLDRLGLFTTEVNQKAREEVISRQQQDMLELSTPVVQLWENILALPLIGTLDSGRTQVVMESLLQRIVETGSQIAIIDITGVPTVDTLVAQHLLKTVTAARLMGADCIISGIRPQIAATIVHLGVDLGNVLTKASLADAFRLALRKTNTQIGRPGLTTAGDPSRGASGSNLNAQGY